MPDGFSVHEEPVRRVISGYEQAVDELAGLVPGLGRGLAEAGAAEVLSIATLTSEDLGETALGEAYGEWIDRCGWALRSRMQTADEFVGQLRTTLEEYRSGQEQAEALFKELLVSLTNPDPAAAARAEEMSSLELGQQFLPDWSSGWGEVPSDIATSASQVAEDAGSLGTLASPAAYMTGQIQQQLGEQQ